jgi:hypothetical protein
MWLYSTKRSHFGAVSESGEIQKKKTALKYCSLIFKYSAAIIKVDKPAII